MTATDTKPGAVPKAADILKELSFSDWSSQVKATPGEDTTRFANFNERGGWHKSHLVDDLTPDKKEQILDFVAMYSFRGKPVVEMNGGQRQCRVEFDPSRIKNGLVIIAALSPEFGGQGARLEFHKQRGTWQPDNETRRQMHRRVCPGSLDHDQAVVEKWRCAFEEFARTRKDIIHLATIPAETNAYFARVKKGMTTEKKKKQLTKDMNARTNIYEQLQHYASRQLKDIFDKDLPTWHDIGLIVLILGLIGPDKRMEIWKDAVSDDIVRGNTGFNLFTVAGTIRHTMRHQQETLQQVWADIVEKAKNNKDDPESKNSAKETKAKLDEMPKEAKNKTSVVF